GKLGREWNGTGQLALTHAKFGGVEVTEWRLPVRWTFDPAAGHGTLDVRDSTATVAQGRAMAQLNAVWTDALRLDGKVQFLDVDLKQALPSAKLGNGRATGRLEVGGEHVRGVDDLKGTLVGTFQQTQALQFPLLRPIAPMLG